jgi:hypothetical protein
MCLQESTGEQDIFPHQPALSHFMTQITTKVERPSVLENPSNKTASTFFVIIAGATTWE